MWGAENQIGMILAKELPDKFENAHWEKIEKFQSVFLGERLSENQDLSLPGNFWALSISSDYKT